MTKKELFNDLTLLQLTDSQFPIGSYSHSYGMETYIQDGRLRDEKALWEFLVNYLSTNFLYNDLVAARLSYEAYEEKNIEKIIEINARLRAGKAQRELREASEKLGSRLYSTLDKMGVLGDDFVREILNHLEKISLPIHHASCYGIVCASLGMEMEKSLLYFTFTIAQALVITAVKSVPISQFSGQEILIKAQGLMVSLVEKLEDLDEDYYFASFPGFEISSMDHEVLYSRLYMS